MIMQDNILVIAPFVPIYDRAMGALRFYQIIAHLAQSHHVVFIGHPAPGLERYHATLEQLRITVYTIDQDHRLSSPRPDDPMHAMDLARLLDHHAFNLVFLERYETAAKYLDTIRRDSPDSLVVVDAEDLLFRRMDQEALQSGDPAQRWTAELQRRKELSVYNRADVLLTATAADRNLVSACLDDLDIRVIPHLHPLAAGPQTPNPADPRFYETWYGSEAIAGQVDRLVKDRPAARRHPAPVCRIAAPYDADRTADWHRPRLQAAAVQPNLTIVIPVFNGLRYTQECVKALRSATTVPYDILLVDNGSTDGTGEWAEREGILTIRNEQNRGFGYACNQGMTASDSAYVALINNDVIVSHGWAERLIAHLKDDPAIGLIGPCTNYAGSAQQIASHYPDRETFVRFAEDLYRNHRGKREVVDHLVGMCLIMPRRVIMEVGLFDPRFGLGNYEDNDYAARTRMAGYRLAIARDVFVHHYGSRTFLENKIDYDATMRENKALFERKWGSVKHPKPAVAPAVASPDPGPPAADMADAPDLLPLTHAAAPLSGEAAPEPLEHTAAPALAGEAGDAFEDAGKAASEAGAGAPDGPEDAAGQPETAEIPAADASSPTVLQWLDAGYALQNEGKPDEAVDHFARAVDAAPDMAEARMAYGIGLFAAGRIEEATAAFEQAADLDTSSPEPYNSLGCMAFQLGDFDTAIFHFHNALERDERHLMAQKNLADVYIQQGAYWDAITMLERVLTDDPEDVEAFLAIGNCYYRLQGFESAIMAYEQALQLDPDNQDASDNLSAAQEALRHAVLDTLETGHVEER
jgi:GT2 family glycosyltransferase/Flp pilus assembly protein TadD